MSVARFHRRFFPNFGWAILVGIPVTFLAAFLARFSRLGWLFLPFGIDSPLGPLGNIFFNICVVFALLSLVSLSKSDRL